MAEYIAEFTTLIDQLKAYAPHPDPVYYIQRFIDGLRDDIKAVVLIQRPSSLDIACVLAQLQEEVSTPRKSFRRLDAPPQFKASTVGAHLLPLPPVKSAVAAETRPPDPLKPTTAEDKYQALWEHRRAQGLCIRCGAKWFRGHKCAPLVQLHVVQELYDLFQSNDEQEDAKSVQSAPTHQIMLHLSVAAVTGTSGPRTMCLMGSLQDQPINILVDSGSSHTFLSDKFKASLSGVCALNPPIQVQVANGAVLLCDTYVPASQWSVQGYTFVSDLKLLPLPTQDMILGLDWLQPFSPMQIHWKQNWLSIPYEDQLVVLYGCNDALPVGSVLHLTVVQQDQQPDSSGAVSAVPPEIAAILQEFDALFQEPTELPPPRSCDHSIPLMEGANPVFIRPYRYAHS